MHDACEAAHDARHDLPIPSPRLSCILQPPPPTLCPRLVSPVPRRSRLRPYSASNSAFTFYPALDTLAPQGGGLTGWADWLSD